MASSTGHLIVVSIALVLLNELLPVMSADVPAAKLESHGKTAPSEGRPVNRRQSLLELDRLLYAYPNDSLDIDGRFSADAHYKKYYECYCNDTMDLFQVTLPCDELMNNTIQAKEEANRVILHNAGIEDSTANNYCLYDLSMKCTLKVYYECKPTSVR
uniref:Uncharacterized protein n=1 Tax=Cacopsylla melanoneura TaxID=428564 RepID=A0A8D9E7S8_9HEMI